MLKYVIWVTLGLALLESSGVAGQSPDEKQEFNQTFKDLIVANDLKEE
jgi:hypothetical protein